MFSMGLWKLPAAVLASEGTGQEQEKLSVGPLFSEAS